MLVRTTAGDTAWMDRDNEVQRLYTGLTPASRNPGEPLTRLRKAYLRAAVDVPGRTRTLRVATYVQTAPGGQADHTLPRLRQYAERVFEVRREIHDATGPVAPRERNGWLLACSLLHEGFVDGIVALDQATVSPDPSLYVEELQWLGERRFFLDLLIAETDRP
ncbi:hypothetical protein [Streptomyces albogriseolus]|uniref:hypothetical protein n=1 Tax=Streptomyces albogriseolus TaxID=1887 RepID=UPI0034616997